MQLKSETLGNLLNELSKLKCERETFEALLAVVVQQQKASSSFGQGKLGAKQRMSLTGPPPRRWQRRQRRQVSRRVEWRDLRECLAGLVSRRGCQADSSRKREFRQPRIAAYNFVSSLIKLIKLKAQRGGISLSLSHTHLPCVCVHWAYGKVLQVASRKSQDRTLRESKVDSKTNAMTSKVLVAYFNLV